ncbi:MAG: hypothetical protein FJX25_06765 [Alphaproteobacteria bacterium]|nr:hypothetical protein [Alphaproteobacteria bacterium]
MATKSTGLPMKPCLYALCVFFMKQVSKMLNGGENIVAVLPEQHGRQSKARTQICGRIVAIVRAGRHKAR